VLVSLDGRAQVVLNYHYSSYGLDESTHPAPVSSPDGTKVMYDSDMLRKGRIKGESIGNADVWLVILRRPSLPRDLEARRNDGAVHLAWKPPLHAEREIYWNAGNLARETGGFCVFRAEKSGGPYAPLHDGLVTETAFVDRGIRPDASGYYVVQAVEYSGLASLFSAEACAAPSGAAWQGDVCHYYEAEEGRHQPPMVAQMDWRAASGGWYVAGTAAEPDPNYPLESFPARVTLTLRVPRAGDYALWVRARRLTGEGAIGEKLSVSLGDASGDIDVSRREWSWYRSPQTSRLAAGETEAVFSLPDASVGLDMTCLTDRTGFVPTGLGAGDTTPPAKPSAVTVEQIDATTRVVRWTAPKDRDLGHFNVYCGRDSDYPLDNRRLLLSPTGTLAVDWGTRQGEETVYKVTAVDRFGNESEPAAAVQE
jgi:hypothetical protein